MLSCVAFIGLRVGGNFRVTDNNTWNRNGGVVHLSPLSVWVCAISLGASCDVGLSVQVFGLENCEIKVK